ncbi:right-handed parallel beta-helix repeat-containing protein [Methanobacterium veterum]|uniref:Ig-like domain repeat protein n=2 Tax=Methanobacterium TaxID=2160 RepID=A0A9E5DJV7_9EURY|nr:right-handed parallel beta-helix repeat-containing protein [Methanobacterium veterum]MCZ3365608.1 Ig-like domain repeat protein [Methanobacterium veterum]MCZ3371071.1 Ig-like domain repeat protein [Methanobacterium veterum]
MRKTILLGILILFFISINMVNAENPVKSSNTGIQDIYVSTTGNDSSNTGANADSPYATIAKGVSNASDSRNATIHLSKGTFTGTGNTEVVINKAHQSQGGSLTIVGAGYNKTFIDANSIDSIFDIKADSIVKLLNLTLINGKSTNGGAIVNEGNLSIVDCIFEKNYATSYNGGGAICSTSGNLTVFNSKFNNNSAPSGYGGAIRSGSTLVNISNSSFTNNQASGAGALYIYGVQTANSTIKNSYFANNSVEDDWGIAGSICIAYGSLINNTIINSTVIGSSGQGGAVYISGDSYLKNNTMTNCSAASGNYIYAGSSFNAKVTFNDATITAPKATVTATVTDDMGHPVYGGSIDFYANGISLGSANVINGTATLKYTKLLENNGLYRLNGTSYYFINNLSNVKNGTLNVNIDRTPKNVYVSTTGSDDTGEGSVSKPYLTISKAIHEAFSTSYYPIVHILEGTYSGSGNTNMSFTDIGVLSLIGETYNKTIIDGGLVNWIFNFGKYTQVNMVNLTIKNGNCSTEYPLNNNVLSAASDLSMIDCIFENNYGRYASIISAGNDGTKVTIKNLIFKDNQVYGAYYGPCYVHTGELDNCHFINNSNTGTSTGAMNGGALYGHNLTVRNSEFINNSNEGTAGAVYVNGPLTSIHNTYSGNYAKEYGGALYAGTITSVNDTFCNNTALINGGAIIANGNITNATFRNNTAGTYGGAIYATNLALKNCSFENNTAGTNGNNIYMYSSGSVSGTISGVNLTFVGNGTVNIDKLTGDLTATVVDDKGNAISGGYVSFYLNGTYIGRADVVNGVATLNYIGFKNGAYNLTGNYSNAVDPVYTKDGVVKVAINEKDSVEQYVSKSGSDFTGDGSKAKPFATIQKALTAAVELSRNITIHLLEGIYSGVGNTNVTLPGTLNLTILGDGIDKSIINGENTNWIFNITLGDGLITLKNFQIINSTLVYTSKVIQDSPIMIAANSTVVIDNLYVNGSHGYYGGAVNNNGNLTVSNSSFANNGDSWYGGAIYNMINGTLTVNNSSFIHNSAKWGTAICNEGVLLVKDSVFKNNVRVSGFTGNGITVEGSKEISGNLNMFNCTFTNNTASKGDLTCYNGIISNSSFYNSTGILIGSASNSWGNITVSNCSFTNITGTYKAITVQTGNLNLNITGCLFKNDSYALYGSMFNPAVVNISNCVILSPVQVTGSAINMTADYNWWGNNTKPVITGPDNFTLNYWLVMTLTPDSKPGFSKNVKVGINHYTDGVINYAFDGYLPVRDYVFNVSNGTISPVSGSLTDNAADAVFNAGTYGNYSVNATIDNQTLTCNFELYQADTATTVDLSNSTSKQGNKIVITANVKDEKSGDPVDEGEVEFFIGNTSIGKAAVHDGKATKEWVIDKDRGVYEINVQYLGSESYLTSDNHAFLTVTSINTTTTTNLSNSSAKYGDRVNVTAVVKETASGNAVNGGVVKFYRGSTLIGTADLVNGIATLKNWIADLTVGKYNITAQYMGLGDYLASQAQKTFEEVFYNGTTWNVYNYLNNTQIQYILNNCVNNSNIIFNSGQYNKLTLTISKPVNVKNKGTVTIVGNGSGTAFTINANATIQGLVIKNYGTAILNKASTVSIANNTFAGNVNGVVNYGSGSGVKIGTNNVFQSSKGSAIYNYGNNLTFKGFKLVNNKVGITNKGSNVDILYNTISGGEYGIVNYVKAADINYNTVSSVSKSGIYNIGSSGKIGHNTLKNNYYGINNSGSSSTITYNVVSGGSKGIVNSAGSVTISGNTVKSVTGCGVYSSGSSVKIYKNTLTGLNKGYGIYLTSSAKTNLVQSNTVSKFYYGLLDAGYKNTLKFNVLKYNKVGLYLYKTAKYSTVTSNQVCKNTNYGVYNKGYKTTLYKNQITYNTKYGLATVKSVKNTKNTIKKNKVNTKLIK